MNVLSLFDGMSCGRLALEKAEVGVKNYWASEIERHPIKVAQANFPANIQLGDVRKINVPRDVKIDLLIGGSPCQSFSFAGKGHGMSTKENIKITSLEQYVDLKKAGFEFEGQSYLFWEYIRLAYQCKPKYYLLENVRMPKHWEKVINETLHTEPYFINSNCLTAQNRKRLYWTNIPFNFESLSTECELTLKNVLSSDDINLNTTMSLDHNEIKAAIIDHFENDSLAGFVDENKQTARYFAKKKGTLAYNKALSQLKSISHKSNCLTASGQSISNSGSTNIYYITTDNKIKIRPLEPVECERLQGVPDDYTNHCSRNQRIKMLGNGWSVDVIAHILKGLKNK